MGRAYVVARMVQLHAPCLRSGTWFACLHAACQPSGTRRACLHTACQPAQVQSRAGRFTNAAQGGRGRNARRTGGGVAMGVGVYCRRQYDVEQSSTARAINGATVCADYVVHPTCAPTVRRYTDGMSTVYRWVEDERRYTVGGRTGQRPYVLTDEATYDQLLWESSQQQREACSRLWQRTAQAWADAGDHWTPDLATRGDHAFTRAQAAVVQEDTIDAQLQRIYRAVTM